MAVFGEKRADLQAGMKGNIYTKNYFTVRKVKYFTIPNRKRYN